jgi:hypothetical protein
MVRDMNRKTITGTLKSKFKSFLKSIDDEKVRKDVENNTIITGGAIASMWLGEEVKDYDLYFTNLDTVLNVAHYFTTKFNNKYRNNSAEAYVQVGTDDGNRSYFNGELLQSFSSNNTPLDVVNTLPVGRVRIFVRSAGVVGEVPTDEPFEDVHDRPEMITYNTSSQSQETTGKFFPVFLSSNAITLTDQFQLILRFYGDAEEIHKNFDFKHATNYYTSSDNKLHINADAMEALMSKELVYGGSKYPLCSIIRTRKFIERGYTINAGQYLKMMFQLSQLDLTDVNVLEEQLIGVDTAYFTMMIDDIRQAQSEDPTFVLDNNYIVSLIDKIF